MHSPTTEIYTLLHVSVDFVGLRCTIFSSGQSRHLQRHLRSQTRKAVHPCACHKHRSSPCLILSDVLSVSSRLGHLVHPVEDVCRAGRSGERPLRSFGSASLNTASLSCETPLDLSSAGSRACLLQVSRKSTQYRPRRNASRSPGTMAGAPHGWPHDCQPHGSLPRCAPWPWQVRPKSDVRAVFTLSMSNV